MGERGAEAVSRQAGDAGRTGLVPTQGDAHFFAALSCPSTSNSDSFSLGVLGWTLTLRPVSRDGRPLLASVFRSTRSLEEWSAHRAGTLVRHAIHLFHVGSAVSCEIERQQCVYTCLAPSELQ